MGLINTAAKIGAKKDLAKEVIVSKIDTAKQKYQDTKASVSEFADSPTAFVKSRYDDAKQKALDDAHNRSNAAPAQPASTVIQSPQSGSNSSGGGSGASPSNWIFKESAGKSGKSWEGSGALTLLLLVAIIAHLYDAFTEWERPMGAVLYIYIAMIVFAFFFIFKMNMGFSEGEFIGAIAIAYLLPYIKTFFPQTQWILVLSGVLFLFPVLPLFLGIKFPDHTWTKNLTRAYIVFWIIVLVFYLLVTFGPTQSTTLAKGDVLSGVRYVGTGVSNTLGKVSTDVQKSIAKGIAQATGQPYEGEEENQKGIYLENTHALESRYNDRSRVYVESKISAKSLTDPVTVRNYCYITGVKQGKVVPETITLRDNDENILDCDLGQLAAGYYDVKIITNFEFETGADITYYFSTSDISSQEIEKINIPKQATAIYSGGPVSLGMPQLEQPLRMDINRDTGQLSSFPFGVSLQNNWQQGKIIKGIYFILDVPQDVTLESCSRNFSQTYARDNQDNTRNIYTFNIDNNNLAESFDAVTCRIRFNDLNAFFNGRQVVSKTFAAKARYEYSVESSTPVSIEKT